MVIADAKVIALGRNVRVDDLVVEKLRALRLPCYSPVVEVEQTPEERKLSMLVQHFDLHEVGELPHEVLHLALKLLQVAIDLGTEEHFHGIAGELCLYLVDSPA